MVGVLTAKERATINRLLRKMTLHVEAQTPSGKVDEGPRGPKPD